MNNLPELRCHGTINEPHPVGSCVHCGDELYPYDMAVLIERGEAVHDGCFSDWANAQYDTGPALELLGGDSNG